MSELFQQTGSGNAVLARMPLPRDYVRALADAEGELMHLIERHEEREAWREMTEESA